MTYFNSVQIWQKSGSLIWVILMVSSHKLCKQQPWNWLRKRRQQCLSRCVSSMSCHCLSQPSWTFTPSFLNQPIHLPTHHLFQANPTMKRIYYFLENVPGTRNKTEKETRELQLSAGKCERYYRIHERGNIDVHSIMHGIRQIWHP